MDDIYGLFINHRHCWFNSICQLHSIQLTTALHSNDLNIRLELYCPVMLITRFNRTSAIMLSLSTSCINRHIMLSLSTSCINRHIMLSLSTSCINRHMQSCEYWFQLRSVLGSLLTRCVRNDLQTKKHYENQTKPNFLTVTTGHCGHIVNE